MAKIVLAELTKLNPKGARPDLCLLIWHAVFYFIMSADLALTDVNYAKVQPMYERISKADTVFQAFFSVSKDIGMKWSQQTDYSRSIQRVILKKTGIL